MAVASLMNSAYAASTDLFTMADDPGGKPSKGSGKQPLRHYQEVSAPRRVKASTEEPGIVTNLTPGACLIP